MFHLLQINTEHTGISTIGKGNDEITNYEDDVSSDAGGSGLT